MLNETMNSVKQSPASKEFDFGVVGLGATGRSVARYLDHTQRTFCAMDTRPDSPQVIEFQASFPLIEMHSGSLVPAELARCRELVVSPGIDPKLPELQQAVASGSHIIGDIELFCRAADAPILAITGTNGKSTVTTMVAHILRCAGKQVLSGGNLGPPALDLLGGDDPEFYVLELSSFQLETTASLKTKVAAVLNISPDHLDRHETVDAYAAVKSRILDGAEIGVINADDPRVSTMRCPGTRITFSISAPASADLGARFDGGRVALCFRDGSEEFVSSLAKMGRHNVDNAAAAAAICWAVGIVPGDIAAALETYEMLPHRARVVAERNGVRFVNDSKATNPGAASSSLKSVADTAGVVMILGGSNKEVSFGILADEVAALSRHVILIGETATEIERAINHRVPCTHAATMSDAVSRAVAVARHGDVVLLAPACASFDMFPSYVARGEAFEAAVEALGDDAWRA